MSSAFSLFSRGIESVHRCGWAAITRPSSIFVSDVARVMTHKDGHQSLPQMRNDRRIIKHFTFGFLPCNLLVRGRVAKWTILAGWPPQVDQGSSRETDGRHLSQRPPTQHVNVYGRSGAFAPNINPQMSSFPYLPRNLTYLYIQIGQTLLQIIFRLLPSSWFRQNSPTSIWTIVSLIRHQGLYEDGFCFLTIC